MKDKLGSEIKEGDTVAFAAMDYSNFDMNGPRGSAYLQTGKVIESASFGVLVQVGGVPATIYTKPDIVIVQRRTEH